MVTCRFTAARAAFERMSDEWQKGCEARSKARALRDHEEPLPMPAPSKQPRLAPVAYVEVKAAMDALRAAETAAARALFRYRVPV